MNHLTVTDEAATPIALEPSRVENSPIESSEVANKIQGLVDTLLREEISRGRSMVAAIGISFVTASILAIYTAGSDVTRLVPMLGLFAPIAMSVLFAWPTSKQKQAMREMARIDDLHAIGPLLDLRRDIKDRSTDKAITAALIRLLPRLKASDSHLLNKRQYETLLVPLANIPDSLVNYKRFPDFRLAILAAISQIGDERAYKHVERLANCRVRSADDARVKEAAEECMPALRERLDRERTGHTLLRPAGDPDTTDSLLRPAGSDPGAPDLLLRPGMPEG